MRNISRRAHEGSTDHSMNLKWNKTTEQDYSGKRDSVYKATQKSFHTVNGLLNPKFSESEKDDTTKLVELTKNIVWPERKLKS